MAAEAIRYQSRRGARPRIAKAPDQQLFKKFRSYLIQHTQLNGSFYGRFPAEWAQPKDISVPVLSSQMKPLSLNR